MAKSTSSLASSRSSSSSCSSSASPSSSSTSSRCSLTSDKTLSLKSLSSIDRRKRLAANARERKRMHLLNRAYDELRQRLVDAENKSKYDVLVQAKEYIQALATICERFDQQHPEQANSINNRQQLNLKSDSNTKMQMSPMDMTYNSAEHSSQSQITQYNRHININLYQKHNQHTNYT